MVHIFPYWDFSEGQLIDVRVCSNAPKIELFFNGESQGVFHIDHKHGQKLIGDWQIPYTKGVLKAVAYDETDTPIATDVQSSFGDAASIRLTPDKTAMTADGSDLIFIEIDALDADGLPVANANNNIHVAVEGPGRLVGLDNGDSTDYDSYKGSCRKLFSGKLLAVIAATLESGTVTVRAESKELAACELELSAVPPAAGSSLEEAALYAYSPEQERLAKAGTPPVEQDAIPVRKLEIVCPQGNQLDADNRTLPVRVIVHPSSAAYRDVQWRLTNAAGNDAPIASLQASGNEALITALSDGEFYIRCGTTNGTDHIKLYSLMDFRIQGLGQTFLNPYSFVSAGYHNGNSRNLTNGNERGVATGRDGESRICFDQIDFGSYGSDEITLPVFSLDSEKFPIEIWEGIPGEAGASLLAEVTYQKPTQWNVYQEETYKLPRKLTGITSLCFVLRRKIHLKGFRFSQPARAFEPLRALDNHSIYGDTFTMTDDAIEQIGNNVSLVFHDMDFGGAGAGKLILCGASPIDNNTIHIQFSGEQGEMKQIVEFAYSGGYTEREFPLERVTGLQTVTFVFLPGSQFHFKWFRFIPAEQ
ncbi:DUF4982 domain-containing protein [Paenibacillus protaetiae]|uniref:DUF4982 domain-containing protein n=1 Tax=Paenibacillus protaetiae TaxID=2509456 RepID=UPI00268EEC90